MSTPPLPANRPLSELVIDPAERPAAPPIEGVTPEQRAKGRHLAAIHRAHRMEIARIRKVMVGIKEGREDPSRLPDLVLGLDMNKNFRAFGNLCGRECQMLSFHHSMEEQHMFPELEQKAPHPFRAIVKRLREEHEIVHALIERLYNDAVALVEGPSETTFAAAAETFEALETVVHSHFGYEETELADAIGVYLDQI